MPAAITGTWRAPKHRRSLKRCPEVGDCTRLRGFPPQESHHGVRVTSPQSDKLESPLHVSHRAMAGDCTGDSPWFTPISGNLENSGRIFCWHTRGCLDSRGPPSSRLDTWGKRPKHQPNVHAQGLTCTHAVPIRTQIMNPKVPYSPFIAYPLPRK